MAEPSLLYDNNENYEELEVMTQSCLTLESHAQNTNKHEMCKSKKNKNSRLYIGLGICRSGSDHWHVSIARLSLLTG